MGLRLDWIRGQVEQLLGDKSAKSDSGSTDAVLSDFVSAIDPTGAEVLHATTEPDMRSPQEDTVTLPSAITEQGEDVNTWDGHRVREEPDNALHDFFEDFSWEETK